MEITISKIVALVIAIGYAIAILVHVGFTPQASSVLLLLAPLGLVWFPEELGSYTGYVGRGGTIDAETPPALVSGIGWLFLVLIGIPVVAVSLGHS